MGNTILLADKSITIQKIVELTFADEDYVIKCVNDGQAALDMIPQISPDIILADISLPVKSGYDICSALRTDPAFAAYSKLPVILLAGIYETMDEDRAKQVQERVVEVGASDLLSKPFDPQALTAKVKEFLVAAPPPGLVGERSIFPAAEAQPMEASGMFAEMPSVSEGFFESTEGEARAEQPPDDTERTMMLPATSAMFAETSPFEEAAEAVESAPVDVAAVTPQTEPVFGQEEMAAMPAEMPEEPIRETQPEMDIRAGDAFTGAEEQQFELPSDVPPPSEPVLPGPSFMEESPFEAEEPISAAPVVVPAGDEPFGDVFADTSSPATWTPSATSEESPFGDLEAPAPPAAPVIEEAPLPEPAELMAPPEMPLLTEGYVADEDTGPQASAMLEESIKPEFGEDTWSRAQAQAAAEQPVEELFETAEPEPLAEEATELQPDFTGRTFAPEEEVVSQPAAVAQAVPPAGGPLEISDDIVERIAERVVAKLSERVVSEIVWQVVPDLAERMIRREIEKLQSEGE